jgi:hypothetical protein
MASKKPAGNAGTDFNFGFNVPGAKAKTRKPKKARPKTGPRTWKGQQYGS